MVRAERLLRQIVPFFIDLAGFDKFADVAQFHCDVVKRDGHYFVQFVLVLPQLENFHIFPMFEQLQCFLSQLYSLLVPLLCSKYLSKWLSTTLLLSLVLAISIGLLSC